MSRRLGSLAALALAGCGDLGENRRDASGSAAGAGLVGVENEVNPATPPPSIAPSAVPSTAPATAPAQGGNAPPPIVASQPSPAAQQASTADATSSAPAEPPQGQMVRERARAGVSGKGDYEPGLITSPVSAYFLAKERIVFDVQIPHAMQLYEAEHGRKPADFEEFTKVILEPNQIKLPTLPPTHTYVYDAQQGVLMVEHPE